MLFKAVPYGFVRWGRSWLASRSAPRDSKPGAHSTQKHRPSAARKNQYSDANYADEIRAEIKLNHFIITLNPTSIKADFYYYAIWRFLYLPSDACNPMAFLAQGENALSAMRLCLWCTILGPILHI
ncbi:hypothetical protein [Budvicia aquatica]|uniref:hypothetical protein n=1 Tax=Budvicia aquatica TaxID=82979 RepID=UPI0021C3EF96|nr:hypothetical protein [Budvicia aquatica]